MQRRFFVQASCYILLAILFSGLLSARLVAAAAVRSNGAEYRLGTGDLVQIMVFGEEDLSLEARITDNGTISYPFLGELRVAGKTIAELEQLITAGLTGPYLVDPKVTVAIGEYRQFFVNGEVVNPGGFPFLPGLTVRKAVSIAGGFKPGGLQDRIKVLHEENPNGPPIPVQLDTLVRPGDIVIVEQTYFYINGEVQQPGSYPFESDLTVRKAVSLAGGFKERASKSKIFVIREGNPDGQSERIGLDESVKPGDIITIEQSFF